MTSDVSWTLSHDFAFSYGGAERVTQLLAHSLFPEAEVLLLGGDREILEEMGISDRVRFLLPRQLIRDRNYRVIASGLAPTLRHRAPVDGSLFASSYAFAHFPRVRKAKVVYCHSPLRQVWSDEHGYGATPHVPMRAGRERILASIRRLDRSAAQEADLYLATSQAVSARIENSYGFAPDALIPPPVDLLKFQVREERRPDAPFVFAGRLVEPYKRLDIVLEAFRRMPTRRLVIAGDGRDAARLQATAPANVEFLGHLDTGRLAQLYGNARALIFPSRDDFGMTPVEAMACGTPVVAFRAGGALDTVIEGRTGVFFDHQDVEALVRAVERVDESAWEYRAISIHASSFGEHAFLASLREVLRQVQAPSETAKP